MPELKVTTLSVSGDNNSVTIIFEDGHRARFEGFRHRQAYRFEGLRHFYLFKNDVQVVRYDGQLEFKRKKLRSKSEHRFVEVEEEYDLERILDYWITAMEHVRVGFLDGSKKRGYNAPLSLGIAWLITREGQTELNEYRDNFTLPL